ncbi:hypothetical protein EVA_04701 [gut metagenome]|uniref:Uncharacterized protein n=1 Tax=gut metagenome TaxID=749906 RepID=J9GW47_9ZZZZ
MLQPAGVVVVFQHLHFVRETERSAHFDLVFGQICTVATVCLRLKANYRSHSVNTCHLVYIILNTFLVIKLLGDLFRSGFIHQHQSEACVDHRLTAHGVSKVLSGDTGVGKYLVVWFPANDGSSFSAWSRFTGHFSHRFTFLELQMIMGAVTVYIGGHPFTGILGGTKAQTVQAQRIFIVVFTGCKFASGIHLTKKQFPVVALLLLVIIHRQATTTVFNLHAAVFETSQGNFVSIALTGFIDRIGKNFKNRMGTPVHTVRAKNNGRTLTDTIGTLQRNNTVVTVLLFFCQNCLLHMVQVQPIWIFHTSP